jgi:transcription antitermination factor NusG
MTIAWYVLRSKPNKESFLWGQVQAHQMEVFYPWIRAKAVNPRARKTKPYFPGYLFVRADLDEVPNSFWRWLPGSQGLVSFQEIPALVPDAMIAAIRRKVDAINAAGGEHLLGMQQGDAVTIKDGPFAEYDAIFDSCLSGNERVRVLLKQLRERLIPVELPAGSIERQKQRP